MEEVCWRGGCLVSVSQIHDGAVATRKEDSSLDLLKEVGEERFELSELLCYATCLLPPPLSLIY